jgi:hypothetical protein
MAMRTAASPVEQLPDSLLVHILRQASGISQQQEQQHDQPLLISTRQQQRYLCGIFTVVSHRWRLAALSICTSLDISLFRARKTELLCFWLLRNGSNVQHLRLQFATNPLPLLSTLPTSTPQLKSLRASGAYCLDQVVPVEAAAAWGALSSLTSLEVEVLSSLAPAVKQLPNLVELSVTGSVMFYSSSLMLIISTLPQLQVLRFPIFEWYHSYCCTKQELDGLSTMQQLQQVDGMRLDSIDLTHPFVSSKCYPSIQIMLSARDRGRHIADWVQRGGVKQVTKLLICSYNLGGKVIIPSISQWSGFTALRSLELNRLDLSPGLQQLRGLTQLTHLKMERCSPEIHSLDQLPPCLCSLSLDNLRSNAALHEQQQQQQQVSSSSTPQLPHLTRLVLTGDSAVFSADSFVPALQSLQQLLLFTCSPGFNLEPLSQLTSVSSLTLPNLGSGLLEGISVLAKFPALQQLEVTRQFITPVDGLEIAATLGHLTAVKVLMVHSGAWSSNIFCGGILQVCGILIWYNDMKRSV